MGVNHRIRPKDQVRLPSSGEVKVVIQGILATGRKAFMIAGNASKAHRRIKVREEDWGLQACRLAVGKVWVNKVETYGITSAPYWWSRLAAASIVRLGHYVLGPRYPLELLLFSDDYLAVASSKDEVRAMVYLIFVWSALGIPFGWKKFRGGVETQWIGYTINIRSFQLGISERRAEWLRSWLEKAAGGAPTSMEDMAAVLGRLCFALGPLETLRPFVAPLFSWSAAVGAKGVRRLPWSVRFICKWIAEALSGGGRTVVVRNMAADVELAFRADAKTEEQLVRVGGWECVGGRPASEARWFAVELNKSNAPWAFARGEPFRTIAALDFFGSLLCVVAFGDRWSAGVCGTLAVSGITDNSGNSYVFSKLMTSKFPLLVVLMELAAQLAKREMVLSLDWVSRDQNEEADALTNAEYLGQDPDGH